MRINVSYSLFYKINFIISCVIFLLFLQYNSEYSFQSLPIAILASISSTFILYILLYITLFIFSFSKKFILYLSGIIFIIVDLALMIDFFIFRLYKFHINAMVINILTSPKALDSIQLGLAPVVLFLFLVLGFIYFQIFLIKKLLKTNENLKIEINRKLNKISLVPLFLILLSEKVTYGFASLFDRDDITSKFSVIPLYQPLTFSRFASKHFGFEPKKEIKNSISTDAKLNYPLKEIEFRESLNKTNIFIIASDAFRNSIISEKVTPSVYNFSKESIVFKNHYSGGNSTRFGIFSLFYSLNSTYWFPFLSQSRGAIVFDILKNLNYEISIVSSTDTNWPEFRKTCYVNISESIKDDFSGIPCEKDKSSSEYFINWIENSNKKKPMFGFLFLDSPHGHSYPKEFAKFKPDGDGEINYLTVDKVKDRNILFNQYKNAINYNDKLFGDILKTLKSKNLYENSIIIFTSDHGEEFNEYGFFGHNSAFSKAQVGSPLIIKMPNEKPKIVQKLTSHNDIMPTLLTYIGVKNSPKDYSNGYNLFDKNFQREFVFSANWNNNAIITNKHSYIFSNLPNKMFKNQIRDTKSYKKIENSDITIDSNLVLETIEDNRRFLN